MLDAGTDAAPRYEEALKVAVNRHDLSVIRVYDARECSIPNVGLVNVKDSETGQSAWVDTSSRKMRKAYSEWYDAMAANASKLFMKYNVDNVAIATDQDYVKGLMAFFQKR